jgi:DNA-3-methyladenine glycosylase
MFLERGHAYVYRIYGRSLCVNVASETQGVGAAVLLRALEPLVGIDLMRARRNGAPLADLARGPGRLTVALGITTEHDGVDLCTDGPLRIVKAAGTRADIGDSVRIGLTKAAGEVLRFYERGNTFVSGPRRLSP